MTILDQGIVCIIGVGLAITVTRLRDLITKQLAKIPIWGDLKGDGF